MIAGYGQVGIKTAHDGGVTAVSHGSAVGSSGGCSAIAEDLTAVKSGGSRTVEGHGGCSGELTVQCGTSRHGEVIVKSVVPGDGQTIIGSQITRYLCRPPKA